jgi:hypothetical protein
LRYNIRINNAKENMTTYTLTQAQLDSAISGTATALLKTLKPNSQEPVGIVSTTPYNGTLASWYPDCVVNHNDLLYTHPAPISTEDMVKVLEALQGNRVVTWQEKDGAWSLSKEITPAPTLEAITIMQSAIEGMK